MIEGRWIGACECVDEECRCFGVCERDGVHELLRSDVAEETGVTFCTLCTEDALKSGTFYLLDEGELEGVGA